MKLILWVLLTSVAAVAQQDVRIQAREMNQDGPVTKAGGDAILSNSTVRIQADSISYNRETGEAEAAGNVRIKFLARSASGGDLQPSRTLTPMERIQQIMKRPRLGPEIMAPDQR